MSRLVPISLSLYLFSVLPSAADPRAWDNALSASGATRFIPVELWTGGDWNGQRDLAMTPAQLAFGGDNHKSITGPEDWVHPVTGETLQVYRRENRGKVQLFTLRADGAGLGRVYDSRGERVCKDGIKFPLGEWRAGESRTFTMTCWKKGRPYARTVTLTILDLDFRWNGLAHALRYHWVVDGGDKPGQNMVYTYVPGRGNVEIEKR